MFVQAIKTVIPISVRQKDMLVCAKLISDSFTGESAVSVMIVCTDNFLL